jgi:hypothetical protein
MRVQTQSTSTPRTSRFEPLVPLALTPNAGAGGNSPRVGPKPRRTTLIDGEPPSDAFVRRAAARQVSAHILASPTATAALLVWCQKHRLSSGPITIIRQPAEPPAVPSDEELDELMPLPGEPIFYRQVHLMRGLLLLSRAEIWFMPQRLPVEMQETLATSDTPFGAVISPLKPHRRTFFVEFPDPLLGHSPSECANVLVEHRAVVSGGKPARPLAVVREQYSPNLIPL